MLPVVPSSRRSRKKKGKCISDYKVDLIINYNGIEHSYIEISDKVENKKAARFS
jgi:hypothetical protein